MTGSTSPSDLHWLRRRPPWRSGLAGALAALLLLAFAGEVPSRILFDNWQKLRPRDLAGSPVHVVLIDSESISTIGPWPWPRYYLARLSEEIAVRGARAIGFDILFTDPDPVSPELVAGLYPELAPPAAAALRALPSLDSKFSDAIGRAPVVLGRAGVASNGGDPSDLAVEAAFTGSPPPGILKFPQAIGNIWELEAVAQGHGLFNGPPDGDGVVRRMPLVAMVGKRPMPGFALEVARVRQGAATVDLGRRSIGIGELAVPIDAQGSLRLHFGVFPIANVHSAEELIRSGRPDNEFRGKTILVGLAAEGTSDIVATPLGAETYGVLTQALTVDALLRGSGWLDRPAWMTPLEWSVGALLALLAILVLPLPGRARIALVVAPPILLVAGSWLAFDLGALLIDPIKPLLVGGGAAAGVAASLALDSRRQRERLREALIDERLRAAAAEGEMQAARTIQLGMLPEAARLASLEPRLDIAALIEPARSVGGDFYDAARLDDGRVAFAIGDVTGKGVPAALFMALSKALAKSALLRDRGDFAGAVAALNDELSRDAPDTMGVTMLIGLIDPADGKILMVNAGHENPLRRDRQGKVTPVAMEGGPPFCVVDYPYPVETLDLAEGEALVLITDGVTEAQDGGGALFGTDRAVAALEAIANPGVESGAEQPAERTARTLLDAVRAFEAGTEPSDDLTVMVVRRVESVSR